MHMDRSWIDWVAWVLVWVLADRLSGSRHLAWIPGRPSSHYDCEGAHDHNAAPRVPRPIGPTVLHRIVLGSVAALTGGGLILDPPAPDSAIRMWGHGAAHLSDLTERHIGTVQGS